MEQKLSDTLVKAIDRSNPMMQNLQLASRFNKLVEQGGGSVTVEALNVTENGVYTAPSGKAYSPVTVNVPSGATDLIFNVKCTSLSNDYLMTVTFPRSNKVTDIAIGGDFPEHYSYNENGYVAVGMTSKAGMKVSVVYDGDTYSYTYTDRDYEQHDLIKE